jgi:hypothetical protein
VIFAVFRAHGGKIAEANRFRSPVSGSTRLSFTGELGYIRVLGPQGLSQHPPGTYTHDLTTNQPPIDHRQHWGQGVRHEVALGE